MEVTKKPCLHQEWIDREALDIVRTLQSQGFITYLVGGCVRDLLLSKHPKDYDIATDARPGDVKRHVRNAYVIGKRFRLVLVKRGDQQFEVATFRRDLVEDEELPEHISSGDNLFGTPEQDANRRDFTINGLLYDPMENKLIDYCEGLPDLDEKMVRMIGDPDRRLREDPIRILRGIRLAHLVRFTLEPNLRSAMEANASTLLETALPRRREEFLKFLRLDDPSQAFIESFDLGLLKYIAPHLHEVLADKNKAEMFTHLVSRFHEKPLDHKDPLQLFGALILAYYRTMFNADPEQAVSTNQILDNPDMLALMRDELGMFKMEQAMVAKALHMQSTLRKRSEFENRGEKRQLAVLQTEAFPLALQFASRDYSLSGEDWLFWAQHYEQSQEKIAAAQAKSRRTRRRTRRKRPAKKGGKSEQSSANNQS
ncbi:MAG: CCA tRNA nucleotidyltransferase [Bdellovibrionaceae bacterium]|nr:CCA tRNA nucleotidyltransferase [Bdellovibrionales bacterium]MCB9084911.1 CCA tRNA nucleotidyltransferase [Pseudobdellovibrionaceae bacterium]